MHLNPNVNLYHKMLQYLEQANSDYCNYINIAPTANCNYIYYDKHFVL